MKKFFVGTLERFGCTLLCVGETEKDVLAAIMKEYEKAYKSRNDRLSPCKEFSYQPNMSDYAVAKEEVYVRELAPCEVEWC